MWTEFQEAFVNIEHRVLGWRLRPFCLYYQFWLDVLDSPLTRGVPASLADLEVACRLCTSGYGEAERAMRPVGKLGQAGWVARWCFSNTQREFGRFDAYLRDYFAPPESRIKAPETAAGKTYEQFPQTLSLAGAIIKHTGWTPEVVWMLPIGQVHWYLAAFLRMDGVETGLITPQDREFIEGIAKERRSKLLAKLKIVPENRKSGKARKRESGGEISRRGAESAEQSGDLTQSRKVAKAEESTSTSRSMSTEGGGECKTGNAKRAMQNEAGRSGAEKVEEIANRQSPIEEESARHAPPTGGESNG